MSVTLPLGLRRLRSYIPARMTRFARFAWGLLAYDVAVVAWGVYVRATGSGAGCGRHWPLCNGEVVPRAPRVQTLVELSHRLSSGTALVLTAVLLVWALRAYPRGHVVVGRPAVWGSKQQIVQWRTFRCRYSTYARQLLRLPNLGVALIYD